MKYFVWIIFLLFGLQSAAWGQSAPTWRDRMKAMGGPDKPRQESPWYGMMPPDQKGVVSWYTLGQVTLVKQPDRVVREFSMREIRGQMNQVKQPDRFLPQFSKDIIALDRKQVKLQGFMMPLEMGEKQKHFLLVSQPPYCAFHVQGGLQAMVEVEAKVPVKYSIDLMVISGRFAVVKDDPTGLYYRLTEGVIVRQ
jgi:hypothetical protein